MDVGARWVARCSNAWWMRWNAELRNKETRGAEGLRARRAATFPFPLRLGRGTVTSSLTPATPSLRSVAQASISLQIALGLALLLLFTSEFIIVCNDLEHWCPLIQRWRGRLDELHSWHSKNKNTGVACLARLSILLLVLCPNKAGGPKSYMAVRCPTVHFAGTLLRYPSRTTPRQLRSTSPRTTSRKSGKNVQSTFPQSDIVYMMRQLSDALDACERSPPHMRHTYPHDSLLTLHTR
jgi:hypothetical protein